MTPSDIEEIFEEDPQRPIKLTLSSGDTVIIPHKDAVRITSSSLVYYPGLAYGRLTTVERPTWISMVNIAKVEPVRPQPRGPRRQRR